MSNATYRLGCDIGGTFTDFVLVNNTTGEFHTNKCLTTPSDPSDAIEQGIRELEQVLPGFMDNVEEIIHGTTLVINAIIERKGAKTALITTKGFRDILELGREKRYDAYDIFSEYPEPIVPRSDRAEIDERLTFDGNVLKGVDEKEVMALLKKFKKDKIESVAVCFINSYENAVNEKKVKEIIEREAPDLFLSTSFEVLPEIKEYERTCTTAVNAYVKPITFWYLNKLITRLGTIGFNGKFFIMLSSGGITSIETAKDFPVRIIESGPTAAVIASQHYGKMFNIKDMFCFDMGGTTAKSCLIQDGHAGLVSTFEVGRVQRFQKGSGLPIQVPVVDLMEIGAGGGSIAKISNLGLLQVGPESAGADPGPACYNQGGDGPTVTDADLVLGYLDPDFFLGGTMTLDIELSKKAIEEKIAKPLGTTMVEAAFGIHDLINETMAAAAKTHIAEKGGNPNIVTVSAFGGAGPVHTYGLAKKIGASAILVPPLAGVGSALGFFTAPVAFDMSRSHRKVLDEADFKEIELLFNELESEAAKILEGAQSGDEIIFERTLLMRFVGQGAEIDLSVSITDFDTFSKDEIRKMFDAEYKRLYGRTSAESPVEFVTFKVRASLPKKPFTISKLTTQTRDLQTCIKGQRPAFSVIKKEYIPFTVYDRSKLFADARFDGPAIIEERESTIVMGEDTTARVDEFGFIWINIVKPEIDTPDSGLSVEGQIMSQSKRKFDPITLEILWKRLVSIVDESDASVIRTAFSSLLRDAHDYTCMFTDSRGQELVQGTLCTPGMAGAMALGMKKIVNSIPLEDYNEGDVFIVNDPWLLAGHLNDVCVWSPIFFKGKPVAFTACIFHHTDIGGRTASDNRDVYAEGLYIPLTKLYDAGKLNKELVNMIRWNVRTATEFDGDIRSQVAANHVCSQKIIEMMEDEGLDTLDDLADEIIDRTEKSMRSAIEKIADGTYEHEGIIEGAGNKPDIPIKLSVKVEGPKIHVDFDGTSKQVNWGVNVVYNFTYAYVFMAIKSAFDPGVPINEGAIRPITMSAPEGTIVNCTFPAAVAARMVVGHFMTEMVFKALAQAAPDNIIAGSGGTPAQTNIFHGAFANGKPWHTMIIRGGGMGASSRFDGHHCAIFPANGANTPVEILESDTTMIVESRSLIEDSGGPGKQRGGIGRQMIIRSPKSNDEKSSDEKSSDENEVGTTSIAVQAGRYIYPPEGIFGGKDGSLARYQKNGENADPSTLTFCEPGDTISFISAGGGGYGNPFERDPKAVECDVQYGYVSIERARTDYGVVIEPDSLKLDMTATQTLRDNK